MNAVQRAIKEVGGVGALASKIGVTYQAVQQWAKDGRVPAKRVLAIEAATADRSGRPRVLRHDLRPDIYPEAA